MSDHDDQLGSYPAATRSVCRYSRIRMIHRSPVVAWYVSCYYCCCNRCVYVFAFRRLGVANPDTLLPVGPWEKKKKKRKSYVAWHATRDKRHAKRRFFVTKQMYSCGHDNIMIIINHRKIAVELPTAYIHSTIIVQHIVYRSSLQYVAHTWHVTI